MNESLIQPNYQIFLLQPAEKWEKTISWTRELQSAWKKQASDFQLRSKIELSCGKNVTTQ
jgi:hypothetical protein